MNKEIKDGAMALLSRVFLLYGLQPSAYAAYAVATEEPQDDLSMDAEDMAYILSQGDLPCAILYGEAKDTLRSAYDFAAHGKAALICVAPDGQDAPGTWYMLADPRPGWLTTLQITADPQGLDVVAAGPWHLSCPPVIVVKTCPGYEGSWNKLVGR